MDWLFIFIALGSVVLGTLIWALYLRREPIGAGAYDVERLRRQMIDDAETEEERAYLKEMDRLELHRRHLVC
jgi:hypothetical protein